LNGNHPVLPFPQVSIGFKSMLSLSPDSTWTPTGSLLYFTSITLVNSLYTPMSYHGFFPVGHKEFESLLMTDSTTTANTSRGRALGIHLAQKATVSSCPCSLLKIESMFLKSLNSIMNNPGLIDIKSTLTLKKRAFFLLGLET
jgi:hypothetical protein